MNITAKVLDKVKNAVSFPVTVTNHDYPIIQESALIVEYLEAEGYKVETFVDSRKNMYGFKVFNK